MRFSLIPYLSGKATHNVEVGGKIEPSANAGFDAKVILTTSMNLDLTINPDYSQVEVDRQRTNLDRFELFFPEKRQFYLENSDLFANLGTENIRPFFSRRIGLISPVQAGARLSGKIGNNWRIGVMDIQTAEKDNVSASNFAVATLQRKVFRRSNISAFIVNKQLTGNQADVSNNERMHNRVAGIEYNLASANNKWTGKAFYHQSFYTGATTDASAMAGNLMYSSQHFLASANQSWVGSDYIADAGYIRRKGYYELNPIVQYKFFPADSRIAYHGPVFKLDLLTDHSFNISDRETQLAYQVEWMNKSTFLADVREVFMKLQSPFDPTNSGGIPFLKDEEFNWKEFGISYTSDIRKPFNALIGSRYGGYFNGSRFTLNGDLYYRVQPYGSLALITSYNKIELPSPYSSAEFLLVGPRLDITFTDKLFLTSLVQYNTQIDNININLRFQWRFAPVSDLYIVYTENTFPGDFTVKNRGLVLKISYWFN